MGDVDTPIPGSCCSRYFELDVMLHRLCDDLELVVCNRCGGGRVQDVCAWTRLQDSMNKLHDSIDRLGKSFAKLSETVTRFAASTR